MAKFEQYTGTSAQWLYIGTRAFRWLPGSHVDLLDTGDGTSAGRSAIMGPVRPYTVRTTETDPDAVQSLCEKIARG